MLLELEVKLRLVDRDPSTTRWPRDVADSASLLAFYISFTPRRSYISEDIYQEITVCVAPSMQLTQGRPRHLINLVC